ncbi:TLC4B-like protein [Mya arenaria]|uniref:TLC4B-like protein n=1 Tax=Mya arenaria TaxID=6604 RepID=A0ABY7FUE8_MYAAR|nr:TLC4B-like protein [Mya arenaria]
MSIQERYRAQELQYDPSYLLAGGVASFLLNILLFRFVSPSVSACLSPAYTRLPRHVRAEWDDRWYFDKLEYSRSRPLVVLNGFLMVATFFLFRMCAMPVYWFQVWQVAGSEAVTRLGHIRAIMFVPTFVLDVLNTFWFYKMCRGFIKAIRTLKTPLKDMERKTV